MPTVTKIAPEEALAARTKAPSDRARTAAQYDALLASFAVGDWGDIVLEAGDAALQARTRLQAAAARRGIALRFARRQGDRLRFAVIAANAVVVVEPPPIMRTEIEPAASEQDTAPAARPAPTPAAPLPELVPVAGEQAAVPVASSAPMSAAAQAAPQRRARPQPTPPPRAPEPRGPAQRDAAPAAQPRQAAATERYRAVLPRWMRDGQPPGRPRVTKRRGRA